MPWVLGGGKHETGLAAIEGPVRKVGGVLGHTKELGRGKPRRIALMRPPSSS